MLRTTLKNVVNLIENAFGIVTCVMYILLDWERKDNGRTACGVAATACVDIDVGECDRGLCD